MDQVAEEEQQKLDTVSAGLVQEDIIKHDNADVRLLVACCLTDIIRIYVPNAPYDDSQLEVDYAYGYTIIPNIFPVCFPHTHTKKTPSYFI